MKDQITQDDSIAWVPFEHCVLSDLNPRQNVDEAGIVTLAENIRAFGLIQNLCGLRQNEDTIGIVAGGRRWRALALLQDDPRFRQVPVRITSDEATARNWATAENTLRQRLHPADEIAAYAGHKRAGASVPDIALAFGVSEQQVYRRLALADLPEPVLAALRDDEITLATATCFTIANDERTALEVLEQIRGQGVSERQLKAWLQPDAVSSTDRRARFVGKEAYLDAGGRITADLFAETDYWLDVDLLDHLFKGALTDAAEEAREAGGWLWTETELSPYLGWHDIEARNYARLYPIPAALSEEEEQELDDLATTADMDALDEAAEARLHDLEAKLEGVYTDSQKAYAGIICTVDHDGLLQVSAGHIRSSEQAAAIDAGVLTAPRHPAANTEPKSAFSAALKHDLEAVTRGARQSVLLDHPDLLLDLLAFQLSGKSGYTPPLALRTDQVVVTPTTETGYEPDKRLIEACGGEDQHIDIDPVAAFRKFRRQSKAKRHTTLIRALAALVDISGSAFGEMIDGLIKPDLRAYWTPTAENFFGRMPASYLDTLWVELLDLRSDHPTVTTFKRLKKRDKAEKLEDLLASPETQSAHGLSEAQQAELTRWSPDTDV